MATWFNYCRFYNWIASLPDMKLLVEVGCYRGESITHLAKKMVESGRKFSLWAVDPWPDPKIYHEYCESLRKAGVRELVDDIPKPSPGAADVFEDGLLDFVFIDADHRPRAVLADIKAWLPKLRKGGILAGHDWYRTTIGYEWCDDDNVSEAVIEAVRQKIIPEPEVNPNTSVWMTRV